MLIFSVLPKELGEQMHSPNDIQENIFKRRNKIWLAMLDPTKRSSSSRYWCRLGCVVMRGEACAPLPLASSSSVDGYFLLIASTEKNELRVASAS